jgi:hypothetical protein
MMIRWQNLRALQGRGLYTTGQHQFFTVGVVNEKRVYFLVGPNRVERSIAKSEFEKAETLGLVKFDVIPQELVDAGIAKGRTAYMAAMLREIAGEED